MKSNLLVTAMAPDALDRVWRRLKNEHTPWSPMVSREELQHHLMRHLLACREEVLGGGYRPLPLRQFPMRKPDGRMRVRSIPQGQAGSARLVDGARAARRAPVS
jgi:RNA-directed DNA polymerase